MGPLEYCPYDSIVLLHESLKVSECLTHFEIAYIILSKQLQAKLCKKSLTFAKQETWRQGKCVKCSPTVELTSINPGALQR